MGQTVCDNWVYYASHTTFQLSPCDNFDYHMRAADACTVHLHLEKLMYNGGYMYEPWPSHFKLPITSLFVVRNIKRGYSFP